MMEWLLCSVTNLMFEKHTQAGCLAHHGLPVNQEIIHQRHRRHHRTIQENLRWTVVTKGMFQINLSVIFYVYIISCILYYIIYIIHNSYIYIYVKYMFHISIRIYFVGLPFCHLRTETHPSKKSISVCGQASVVGLLTDALHGAQSANRRKLLWLLLQHMQQHHWLVQRVAGVDQGAKTKQKKK